MIHLSTAFAVKYRQNESYSSEDRRIKESIEQAQRYHTEFVKHDALQMLDNYFSTPRSTDIGIDKLSLALAYLKYQHHPDLNEIAHKIDESKLIDEEDKVKAFEYFFEACKTLLLQERETDMEMDETVLDKVAREVITHFFNNRMDKAIELFDDFLMPNQQCLKAPTMGLFASSNTTTNEPQDTKTPKQGGR